MRMTGEKLFEAIGLIDDRYFAECDAAKPRARLLPLRLAIAAAACVGLAAVGTLVLPALGGVPAAPETDVSVAAPAISEVTDAAVTSVSDTAAPETSPADTSVPVIVSDTSEAETSAPETEPPETSEPETSPSADDKPDEPLPDDENPAGGGDSGDRTDPDTVYAGGDGDDDAHPATGGWINGSSDVVFYASPVLPLTLLNEDGDISAERSLTYDFEGWTGADAVRVRGDAHVVDRYTLTNTTAQDKTVTVLYPFDSMGIIGYKERLPELKIDGRSADTGLVIGGFAGGYDDQYGWRLNLTNLNGYEDFRALLSDGTYLEHALSYTPDLENIPVTVYKFSDAYCNISDDNMNAAPSVSAKFGIDADRTAIYSYGFNSSSWKKGKLIKGYFIGKTFQTFYSKPKYLVVVGEDISEPEITYHVNGSHTSEKLPEGSAGVTVTRYETDMYSALREIVGVMAQSRTDIYGESFDIDFEQYFRAYCDFIENNGLLSDDPPERYDDGGLDMLSDADICERVMYVTAEVTVPAGGSTQLDFTMSKVLRFYCLTDRTEEPVTGYDTAVRLGSNLNFTGISAEIKDYGAVEIVDQNFGFDLENGITTVTLDPNEERYFIEVKKKNTE